MRIEGASSMKAIQGNPAKLAKLPWRCNKDMLDAMDDPDKRAAVLRYALNQGVTYGKKTALFMKMLFEHSFRWHIMPYM